jgi:glycosyltransferase involved in cell wall biosynthesis
VRDLHDLMMAESAKRPTIVCISPVKNEAHNLPRFLACASLWADRIIVADQNSDDNSAELVQACPKAQLIRNESKVFNEAQRQILLLDAARKIPGPRVIVAMDADEILPTQLFETPAWDRIIYSPPGTVGQLQFINMLPGMKKAIRADWLNRIYVDDEHPHTPTPIHSSPVPFREQSPTIRLPESMLLHYAMVDANRYARRQIWYQCLERLNTKDFGPIQLYRRYFGYNSIPDDQLCDVNPTWFTAYEREGIEVRKIEPGPTAMYDRDILAWMTDPKIGTRRFNKLAIWHIDWNSEYRTLAGKPPPVDLGDPRSWYEKTVHRWLARTQPHARSYSVRGIQRVLRLTGW